MRPPVTPLPEHAAAPNSGAGIRIPGTWAAIGGAVREHRWFAGTATLALLLFGAILTQGSGNLLVQEYFSDFYDYQAASLLKGRLDVPHEAITFEAFVHQGRIYSYFGLTPALLRLPWVALNLGFGHSSRAWMLAYYAGFLVAGYLVLLEAGRRGDSRAAPAPWITVLFAANAGLANTAFFLGSRAYVYHEAILCGVTFAVWSVWATLRYLREPRSRWWIGALVAGLLSLHARPPTGLFALAVLGLAGGWLAYAGRGRDGLARGLMVGLLATLGVGSFNAVSYLKFGTFDGCPLRLNIQYSPERLAKIDGRQFHLSNLPFSANAYLFQPHANLSPYFPYVRPTRPDPSRFPGAKIDMSEPILGVPFAMPALFLLAGLSLASLRRPESENRTAVLLIWCGMMPVGFSMFAAIAVSHRYTADFVPFLVVACAFGCVQLWRAGGTTRRAGIGAAMATTLVAVPLNFALTLQNQGEVVWGVPDPVRARYAGLRQTIDGWFHASNPAGYDIRSLASVRRIDADLLSYLSQVYSAVPEKRAAALSCCQRVVELTPQDPVAHARLGTVLLTLGRLPEAAAALELAVHFGPRLTIARHNLGTTYLGLKRVPEAVAQFEAALEADPGCDPALKALQSLGRRPKSPPPNQDRATGEKAPALGAPGR